MEKNVGGYDRLSRLVLGPVLLVIGVVGLAGILPLLGGTAGLLLAGALFLVGSVLLVTGVMQRCLLNDMLGFDTYEDRGEPASGTDRPGSETRR